MNFHEKKSEFSNFQIFKFWIFFESDLELVMWKYPKFWSSGPVVDQSQEIKTENGLIPDSKWTWILEKWNFLKMEHLNDINQIGMALPEPTKLYVS